MSRQSPDMRETSSPLREDRGGYYGSNSPYARNRSPPGVDDNSGRQPPNMRETSSPLRGDREDYYDRDSPHARDQTPPGRAREYGPNSPTYSRGSPYDRDESPPSGSDRESYYGPDSPYYGHGHGGRPYRDESPLERGDRERHHSPNSPHYGRSSPYARDESPPDASDGSTRHDRRPASRLFFSSEESQPDSPWHGDYHNGDSDSGSSIRSPSRPASLIDYDELDLDPRFPNGSPPRTSSYVGDEDSQPHSIPSWVDDFLGTIEIPETNASSEIDHAFEAATKAAFSRTRVQIDPMSLEDMKSKYRT